MNLACFDLGNLRRVTQFTHARHNPDMFQTPNSRIYLSDSHLLVYHIRGKRTMRSEGHDFLMDRDNICVYFGGVRHDIIPPGEPYEELAIWIGSRKGDRLLKDGIAAGGAMRENHVVIPVQTDGHSASNMRSSFERAMALLVSLDSLNRMKADYIMSGILLDLALAWRGEAQGGMSREILLAVRIIESHPTVKLNVPLIARKTGMSPRNLTLRFKKETGLTMFEYMREVRVNMAKSMLTTLPRMPFKAISENLGFHDEFHFSKTFKKSMGVSPRNYRDGNPSSTASPPN